MLKIFFENRLVYQQYKNPEDFRSDEDLMNADAEAMIKGDINDSKTAEEQMTQTNR